MSEETQHQSTRSEGGDGQSAPRSTRSERRSDPERLLTLTDGVFAIIITILVLDIRVPSNLGQQSLRSAIHHVGPTLTAWVISFLITGMYWVWHRDVFASVRRVNREVVWLNLLFLVPVGLIPFAASVLGEYDTLPVALHTYGLVLIMVSVMRTILYWYLSGHPELLWERVDERQRRIGLTVAPAPILAYAIAMALADPVPRASLALYALVPLLYFLGITLLRDRSKDEVAADDYS